MCIRDRSGWDGNPSHELWRQSYGSGGAGYNFGVNAGGQSGGSEGDLPVIGLVAEKSQKATFGFDLAAFDNRLNATVEGFYEKRSDILVSGANSTSGIIGITVDVYKRQCLPYGDHRAVTASVWTIRFPNRQQPSHVWVTRQ